MPQCKMGNCREEAIPGGKRYCPHHMAEYKRKQAEYNRISATLPDCEDCGHKLGLTRHNDGHKICVVCETQRNINERLEAAADQKAAKFNDADTLDKLKDWLKEYVL